MENLEDPQESPVEASTRPPLDEDDKVLEVVVLSNSEKAIREAEVRDGSKSGSQEDNPKRLREVIASLESDRGQLTAEVLEKDLELSCFEKEIANLKAELAQKNDDYRNLKEVTAQKYKHLKDESAAKILELKKQFDKANRDKEAMVMKYAIGEKDVIFQRNAKEEAQKQAKNLQKDKEALQAKVKGLSVERNHFQQLADSRLQDINVTKKEVERWKEEVKCVETKAASLAGLLKAEVDAHRGTREQLDMTIKHLAETRAEIAVTRKECQDFMQRYRDEEKQKKVAVQEQSVKMMIDAAAAQELESLRVRHKSVIEENNALSVKIQRMETDRLEYDANISKLKETVASQKQEVVDLLSQVAEMEGLRMQLQRETERCEAKSAEVERLRREALELQGDMTCCRQKEAELLAFTQKLTDKNVVLQSDLTALEAKASALEVKHSRLVNSVSSLESSLSTTRVELENERRNRKEDTEMLAKKLAEKSKKTETLSQRIIDAENEVCVLKRKNASALKELTRELQQCRKRQEGGGASNSSPGVLSSRTSSNSSLNCVDSESNLGESSPTNSRTLLVPENGICKLSSQNNFSSAQIPDSQVLIEKIMKLQRILARKQEKNEFMEEHIATLQEELKKKNKVIQNYFRKLEPGALTPASMDENKRKISDHGGIMASLYSSKQSDSDMTLELSLEINQKLQAVLEDTLLKNITLKENINTLGNEIAAIVASKNPNK